MYTEYIGDLLNTGSKNSHSAELPWNFRGGRCRECE